MWQEFKEFIDRGNLMQLAVAFIMGVTFAAVVTSLVNDIIMPLSAWDSRDGLQQPLRRHQRRRPSRALQYGGVGKRSGAVTINYGIFINAIIVFIIVAVVLFFLMKAYMKTQKAEVTTKEASFCKSTVPLAATRRPHVHL